MKTKILLISIALITSFVSGPTIGHATHDDFVVLATSAGGGNTVQVFGLNGAFRTGWFILNNTFSNIQLRQNVKVGSGSGHERILVGGTSPSGPAFQVFERNGTPVSGLF
jgi:hypothetical protein